MLSQLATFTVLSFTLLAVATPVRRQTSCATGPVQCCTSTETSTSAAAQTLLGLLGIVLNDVDVLIGTGCSPISVIGVGNGACSSNAVCCTDNSHGNLISIGCVPITL
ncbi:hypothetical protein QCA50_020063 [Cerrena zonata]|uniref:Hydrophobin n=1 Tax=Cerrena zonata TaxID=2478898 RepID=A0AAW0FJW5_9APHY